MNMAIYVYFFGYLFIYFVYECLTLWLFVESINHQLWSIWFLMFVWQGVLDGKYDDLSEQSFYMVGGIEEVIAKAEKIAKESAA